MSVVSATPSSIPVPVVNESEETQKKVHNLKFSQVIDKLRHRGVFFASVLGGLRCVPDKRIPTMGVMIEDRKYVLRYHPEWFQYLTSREFESVITHECLHMLWGHLPRFVRMLKTHKLLQSQGSHQTFNIAADMAINSIIQDDLRLPLPEGCVLPQSHGFPPKKTMEWYFAKLMEKAEKEGRIVGVPSDECEGEGEGVPNNKPSEGDETGKNKSKFKFGSHDWQPKKGDDDGEGDAQKDGQKDESQGNGQKADGQGGGEPKIDDLPNDAIKELEDQSKKLFEEAKEDYEHAGGTGCTRYAPSGLIQRLEVKKPMRNWGMVLLDEIKNRRQELYRYKINQLNKGRLAMGSPIGLYGSYEEIEETFKILAGVDVSGSMSDDAVRAVFGICQSILDQGNVELKVIAYDDGIREEHEYKSGQRIDAEFHGRGGTNFTPFMRKASELAKDSMKAPDIVINLTDCDAYPTPEELNWDFGKIPYVWVIQPGHSAKYYADRHKYGKKIFMETLA